MKTKGPLEEFANIEQLVLRVGWLEQRRFAQDLSDFGLTVPQFFVLHSVFSRECECTMSALADDAFRRSATMTGIVDRLLKMGLVTRERDAKDRRRVLVQLTPAGREVLAKVRQGRKDRLRDTLGRLSAPDAMELQRLLKLYLEAFRAEHEEAGQRAEPGSGASAEAPGEQSRV